MGSLGKIAVLVAIVAIAWFGWRWFGRWEKERRVEAERRARAESTRSDVAAVEDLRACGVCGAFVAATARDCGRPGCPYPA